ncbi:MAG: ABC transporter ATP-binding protein [Bacteroidota bacterium]
MAALRAHQIFKSKGDRQVLRHVDVQLEANRKVALVGETGSGKSTLLRTLAGLEQPDQGEVWLGDEKVRGPADTLVPGHPKIAYLSQHFELPKFVRVEQALAYASQRSAADAHELYAACRIDHLMERKTDQLSGGERQRVALARLLSTAPDWLLLDEPFSNLDRPHKMLLKSVLEDITTRWSISCVLVSHEPADTLSWADVLLVMKEGTIRQHDHIQHVYRYPADAYVAGLLGSFTELSAAGRAAFQVADQRVFFRPEDFSVASEGVPGKVAGVVFYGSHEEALIDCAHDRVVVRTAPQQVQTGQAVHLQLR